MSPGLLAFIDPANLPAIVKLGVVFALMLVLLRLKLYIGWTLCVGAVITGYWFTDQPDIFAATAEIGESIRAAAISGRYIVLVSLIMFVLVLNHSLRAGGQINRIVDTFFNICRRPRTTLLFFPALLGLLPMPGGALFSAPMVEAVGKPLDVNAHDKTLINYWFRHIWEYCWPLYPGIILTAVLTGYPIAIVIIAQAPLMLACALVGFIFFLRHLKGRQRKICPPTKLPGNPYWAFILAIMPIILVIVLYAVLEVANKLMLGAIAGGSFMHLAEDNPVHRLLSALPQNSMLVVSVTVAIIFTWLTNRMNLPTIGRVFWQKDMRNNLIIALGIIVFAGVLEGSGAAGDVSTELDPKVVPTWMVAFTLPFIVGAITGITMNMVVLTYPIFLGILAAQGKDTQALGYCCLAFTAGYGAILLTPLHICMLQSNEFFGLGPLSTIRRLIIPTLLVMLAGGGLFLFYNWLLPYMGWMHTLPEI